jgi:hypothetical protein
LAITFFLDARRSLRPALPVGAGDRQAALPVVLTMTLSAGLAHAASLPSRHILTLEAARTAKAEGWSPVIYVVDSDGLPIILERMANPDVLAGHLVQPEG